MPHLTTPALPTNLPPPHPAPVALPRSHLLVLRRWPFLAEGGAPVRIQRGRSALPSEALGTDPAR
eukprot:8152290-Pyramimonas_sp.AAC.1